MSSGELPSSEAGPRSADALLQRQHSPCAAIKASIDKTKQEMQKGINHDKTHLEVLRVRKLLVQRVDPIDLLLDLNSHVLQITTQVLVLRLFRNSQVVDANGTQAHIEN